jgi:hypothetical protein
MQSSSYEIYRQLAMVSAGLHFLINVAMIVVMIAGWRRHHRTAFLVLLGWAIIAASASVMQWGMYPLMQNFGSKLFGPSVDTGAMVMVANLVAYLASSLLLFTGLAMLVFGKEPQR